MAYLWTTENDIQDLLDTESTIALGDAGTDNYSSQDAQDMENRAVRHIVQYLLPVYNISTDSSSDFLEDLAAKLTAAYIGTARMGSSMGNELTHWTTRYKNEVHATLNRLIIDNSLIGEGITAKTIPLWKRLLFAKTRERAVVSTI
jgi:hypothetical protein